MPQYTPSDIKQLYWADNDGFKGGRDPLGVQNSSIATYGCLIPGMTNLTGHYRYYSLFSWLLDEYTKHQQTKNKLHQLDFIRRSELLLAFIMRDAGVNAVIGADYVAYFADSIVSPKGYQICKGADLASPDKQYWSFQSGAFGQYYLGSLISCGLVKYDEQNRYYTHTMGKRLRDAFIASVDAKVRNRFISCVESGCITEDDILALEPISLHEIKVGSEEWNVLNSILVQESLTVHAMRRESMLLLLNACKQGISEKQFTAHAFNQYASCKNPYSAAWGWVYYYMCESMHYAMESVFWYVLKLAADRPYMPIDQFISICSSEITALLPDDFRSLTWCDFIDLTEGRLTQLVERQKATVRSNNSPGAAAQAIDILACAYRFYRSSNQMFLDFEKHFDIGRQQGCVSDVADTLVTPFLDLPMGDFAAQLVKQVMTIHTLTACRKMGATDSDLRKFLLEDGCVVGVEVRKPQFTNPRVDTLRSYLYDMDYLESAEDERGNLTDVPTPIADAFIAKYAH